MYLLCAHQSNFFQTVTNDEEVPEPIDAVVLIRQGIVSSGSSNAVQSSSDKESPASGSANSGSATVTSVIDASELISIISECVGKDVEVVSSKSRPDGLGCGVTFEVLFQSCQMKKSEMKYSTYTYK